jgi:hypothetical protein
MVAARDKTMRPGVPRPRATIVCRQRNSVRGINGLPPPAEAEAVSPLPQEYSPQRRSRAASCRLHLQPPPRKVSLITEISA